ncbi:MAG: phosphoenolpyruvate hydrolase family protein [Planctomycetota bacterium]|nr:phosphoenolpyruvate hydrolase family protein [Planctomycetota bacterium]
MDTLQNLLKAPPERRTPLIVVVAGSGQVAGQAVKAGADVLMVLNAGRYRSAGAGSLASFLPYGNANAQTLELLGEILPKAAGRPAIAGVWAADPGLDLDAHLDRLAALGVQGVVNWPTLGFTDGVFRESLVEDGWTLDSELELLRRAQARGLSAWGFVLDRESAARFAEAGVPALVLNLGLTRALEDIRARRDQLRHAIARLNGMLESVAATGRRPWRLAFGGPVTAPEDLEELFRHSDLDGFAGGSVFERLPVQTIVDSTVRRFKGIAQARGRGAEGRGLGELAGRSPTMEALFARIRRVAPHGVNVLIEGESGTGKELVATLLHRLSPRKHRAFVTLNCGAIPETLLESELFGHEKGAFTGADRRRPGKFELADGGTLFLDEVADLSPHGQVALLRALQQREVTRVGGEASLPVDVRVVAASNRPLRERVEAGAFRADLFYRLNQFALRTPALRERPEDLPILVDAILTGLQAQLGRAPIGLSSSFYERLARHSWPGNVRELQHAITQAALLEDAPVLEGRQFEPLPCPAEPAGAGAAAEGPGAANFARPTPAQRRAALREALARHGGNRTRAARELGIARKTLYAWLKEAHEPSL